MANRLINCSLVFSFSCVPTIPPRVDGGPLEMRTPHSTTTGSIHSNFSRTAAMFHLSVHGRADSNIGGRHRLVFLLLGGLTLAGSYA